MGFDLKKITRGRKTMPNRVLLYGMDGCGKTTTACGAPAPFVIDANKGAHRFDVQRYVPETFAEAGEAIEACIRGDIKCETIVLDTISDLEAMSHKEMFPDSNVADWGGGWGKGDQEAIARWREFVLRLERAWLAGKHIVLVAHVTVKAFADPMGATYDRFEVAARPRLAGLLRGWCDFVCFCREDVATQKVDGKERARTTGVRSMYTQRSAAFDAKARGTSLFPPKLLLSWRDLASAIAADDDRAASMRKEIDGMLAELGDAGLTAKVTEFLRMNPNAVVESHNRVSSLLEEKKKTPEAIPSEKAKEHVNVQG